MPKNESESGHLRDIKCREIIPVELNAFIHKNAKLMAGFYKKVQLTMNIVKT